MTIPWVIYAVIAVLAVIPAARMVARAESVGGDDQSAVLFALFIGAVIAYLWPLAVVAAAIWWLVNRDAVRRLIVPESDDAKIRRLEQRNEELERELGL